MCCSVRLTRIRTRPSWGHVLGCNMCEHSKSIWTSTCLSSARASKWLNFQRGTTPSQVLCGTLGCWWLIIFVVTLSDNRGHKQGLKVLVWPWHRNYWPEHRHGSRPHHLPTPRTSPLNYNAAKKASTGSSSSTSKQKEQQKQVSRGDGSCLAAVYEPGDGHGVPSFCNAVRVKKEPIRGSAASRRSTRAF